MDGAGRGAKEESPDTGLEREEKSLLWRPLWEKEPNRHFKEDKSMTSRLCKSGRSV